MEPQPTPVVLGPNRATVTTRRRPTLILAGIILAILGGLLAFWVYDTTQTQNNVIQVRRNIARGEIIQNTDLVAVTIGPAPGVSTVPATDLSRLVGQRALIDLHINALLPAGSIGQRTTPESGRSLIGIRLEPGRIMTGTITPGSKLRLVVTDIQAAQITTPTTTKTETASFPATMVESAQSLDGAATIITVEVDHKQAEQIAPLAAAGRIVVVKDSDQ